MHKLKSKLILPAAITVCLLLLMQSVSYAGSVPDGLAGVPWGATRDQVKKIMIEKGFKQENVHPTSGQPYPGLVFYGSFANRICYLTFTFKGNAFYVGQVIEKSYAYQPILAAFNYFVPMLTDKYGMPDESLSYQSTSPGHPVMPSALWKFRDSASSDVYTISAYTGDSIYEMSGRRIVSLNLMYEAVSLGNRLKEDGL